MRRKENERRAEQHWERFERALNLQRQGKFDEAAALYEVCVSRRCRDSGVYTHLWDIYTRQRKFEQAQRVCELATVRLDYWPERVEQFERLGRQAERRTQRRKVRWIDPL